MNLHLLSGPQTVHLPPRLYDFEFGYQMRKTINSTFSYDLSTMVGIYSDFEDSARDGVRFPSHAVGMFHPDPRIDWVFGIDYSGATISDAAGRRFCVAQSRSTSGALRNGLSTPSHRLDAL